MVVREFDFKKVEFSGEQLIEASAGTGKTFSLGLLVLKAILDDVADLDKILIVTFTNDATRELKLRIRKFLTLAYKYFEREDASSKVNELAPFLKHYKRDTILLKRLADNLILLDEAHIYTIHSFCMQLLKDYPIEFGIPVSFTLEDGKDEIIELELENYWRNYLLRLEKLRLEKEIFRESGISYGEFQKSLWNALAKPLPLFPHQKKEWEEIDEFLEEKKDFLLEELDEEDRDWAIYNYRFYFYLRAYQKVVKSISQTKEEYQILTYDDLIEIVHRKLVLEDRRDLLLTVKSRYQLAFIDEFQDTDSKQYEIFSTLFQDKAIFYIGDPKQSIYKFRGADLNQYLQVKEKIPEDSIFTLKRNYRTNRPLIDKFNRLFSEAEDFFLNPLITYEEIIAEKDFRQQNLEQPLVFYRIDKDYKAEETREVGYKLIVKKVVKLLSSDCLIEKAGELKPITPQDIAVLVPQNEYARKMKAYFRKAGVPAVIYSEEKLFETPEAQKMALLLESMLELSPEKLNRILAYFLPEFDYTFLLKKNFSSDPELEEKYNYFLDKLWEWKGVWQRKGILQALHLFFEEFKLAEKKDLQLENLYHLSEVLSEKERRGNLSPGELYSWYLKALEAPPSDLLVRLSGGDDVVRIMTIHKSKGLEFNFVFLPSINLHNDMRGKSINKNSFYKLGDNYLFLKDGGKAELEENLRKKLQVKDIGDYEKRSRDEENRRLFYVALTRAKYACFLVDKEWKKTKSIKRVLQEWNWDELAQARVVTIEDISREDVEGEYRWEREKVEKEREYKTFPQDILKESPELTSFSSLFEGHLSIDREEVKTTDPYEEWIFSKKGGARFGNFIHTLLEEVECFSVDKRTEKVLEKVGLEYADIYQSEEEKDFVLELLDIISKVELKDYQNTSFSLSQIPPQKMRREMNFYFPFSHVDWKIFYEEILGRKGAGEHSSYGFFKGFIDLVFTYQGKFYLLDWKTNYLGSRLVDYDFSREEVRKNIIYNNYEAQYLIYTLALWKFYEFRVGEDFAQNFGGVFYLFLRGLRKGQGTGIFYAPPEPLLEQASQLRTLVE